MGAGRGAWIRTTPAGLDTGRSPLDTPLCIDDAGTAGGTCCGSTVTLIFRLAALKQMLVCARNNAFEALRRALLIIREIHVDALTRVCDKRCIAVFS